MGLRGGALGGVKRGALRSARRLTLPGFSGRNNWRWWRPSTPCRRRPCRAGAAEPGSGGPAWVCVRLGRCRTVGRPSAPYPSKQGSLVSERTADGGGLGQLPEQSGVLQVPPLPASDPAAASVFALFPGARRPAPSPYLSLPACEASPHHPLQELQGKVMEAAVALDSLRGGPEP